MPSDAQVVGYTWRFVNRDGGPDRRFNNNRQIPQALYQQMGLQGSGGFQKILHVSKVESRDEFNASLRNLSLLIRNLEHRATGVEENAEQLKNSPLVPAGQQPGSSSEANTTKNYALILPVMLAIVGTTFGIVLFSGVYVMQSAHVISNLRPTAIAISTPAALVPPSNNSPTNESTAIQSTHPAVGPSFNCGAAHQPLARVICADPTLSATDLRYVQAYQALRQASHRRSPMEFATRGN